MTSLTPTRFAFAASILLAGFSASIALTTVWPVLYPSTAWAFTFMGATIACAILARAAQGGARAILTLLAIVFALAWAAFGLYETVQLGGHILTTIGNWRRAGTTPVGSLQAAPAVLRSLTPPQVTAYSGSFTIGLVPILALASVAFLFFEALRHNRVVRNGPWRASWMPAARIRELRNLRVGLPLGLKGGHILRYAPNPARGWRAGHHAVIAGTRAGKGVSAVIPAIIDHDGPVVVLDVKGENFAVTRRHRESLGRRVIVLNPFGLIEGGRDSFNPLDYVRPDHLVRDIDVIAEGLVQPEGGTGAHFSSLAAQLIAGVIEFVVSRHPPETRNLNMVAGILFAADFEDRMKAWASAPFEYGVRPAQAAATIISTGENERGAIRSTIKKAFEWAKSDEMRRFLASSTATLDALLDDRIDVFIVVPLDQLGAQAVFMRLIVNMILGTVVRQDGRRRVEKPILLVLDEFVRLGRMEKLVDLANVAAGAGIEAMFITQNKGQIDAVYGEEDADSILGSCATTRVFSLGRGESYTGEWIAKSLGDQTIVTRSRQAPLKLGERARISTTEHRQKLMAADEVLEMPAGEIVCLIGSNPPLRIKAIISHEHPAYRRKLDPNPTRII